jgi:hypothetical protein
MSDRKAGMNKFHGVKLALRGHKNTGQSASDQRKQIFLFFRELVQLMMWRKLAKIGCVLKINSA